MKLGFCQVKLGFHGCSMDVPVTNDFRMSDYFLSL